MSATQTDPQASKPAPLACLPVPGVTLAAVEAGVRYPNRKDLVAIAFAEGTRAAAMFTRNAFCAAPVHVAREHLAACAGQPRLLLINTGNANAGTGDVGMAAARNCCDAAAAAAGVDPQEVLPFSTGVIGEFLPVERIVAALPSVLEAQASDHWADAARGIMTTDTLPKGTSREIVCGDKTYVLSGIAKGAGMLRPNMATMLAFLATDAPIAGPLLQAQLAAAVEASFHRITVDGDTSTNDAILLAATGAGDLVEDPASTLAQTFAEALNSLCLELAQALIRDAEGASKFIEIRVSGGADAGECLAVGFTIAHSPLVKTALFAADPNWGRLLAAIGRAGVTALDVSQVTVRIDDYVIAEHGARSASYAEEAIAAAMAKPELVIGVDLGRGSALESVWTSDLSHDYVRINASYRS